jgi:hypothetical protein
VYGIISDHHEDVRKEEYLLVSRKIKDGNYEEAVLTEREKRRPVEKIIKNIELSYYNFEKKEVKRVKDKQASLSRNKKSMPALPLYQHTHKAFKHSVKAAPVQINPALKPKDTNKLSIKSRSK